ncbi:MAG: hypothetical protein IKN41_04895 [Candidatus Methanomethylophilaceae archaeon]|nr:hypothetical protein [Candidatus Methanomethylophilaceae archaeon]
MTSPCSRCHNDPVKGSIYSTTTGQTTYYVVCTTCGRKVTAVTRDAADRDWEKSNEKGEQNDTGF